MKWIVPLLLAAGATLAAEPARETPAGGTPARERAGLETAGLGPILHVEDVRIGARGYGLTVFHGTTIEPFAVEVVSIEHNASPGRSVIWIRCPEERMQKTGPVQGMSGSPIYLWDETEPQDLGQGGKLIGAFAFGFGLSKDCYVGVQPVRYMLEAAERAQEQPEAQGRTTPAGGTPARGRAGLGGDARRSLATLLESAQAHGAGEQSLRLGQALLALYPPTEKDSELRGATHLSQNFRGPRSWAEQSGQFQPLLLPMTIPSPAIARVIQPLTEPMGLAMQSSPLGATAGKAPAGVDIAAARFVPGAVLAVPLAYGDLDLSASGTVTAVLDDGRVLAFGHPMFNQGQLAAPMATGFVHMVIPNLIASFKLGGSGVIRGALVRDEAAAVVGKPEAAFAVAPASVNVSMAGQPPRQFHYQLVHHRELSPILGGILCAYSLTASQGVPTMNTLRMTGTLSFTGGRELELNVLQPAARDMDAFLQVALPTLAVMQNPFEPIALEALRVEATVEPVQRSCQIVDAHLTRAQVQPGQDVSVSVRLQPFGQPVFTRRVDLTIPRHLPDGEYPLLVCDGQMYQEVMLAGQPHQTRVAHVDELFQSVRRVMAVKQDALYVLLQLPEEGLAVGRTELPSLPSSRRALIAAPSSTLASPYMQWKETVVPMDYVVQGQLSFTVSVKKKAAAAAGQ